VNLLASNLADKTLVSILDLNESSSENNELNKINIEGILIKLLISVLFNNANIITQIWEGFK
jgi:hypothetical protein